MRKSLFASSGMALVLLLSLPGTAGAATTPPRTIKVNCNKGQSVQAALDNVAAQLVVEITGVCAQTVTITRDDVTLRGVDGAIFEGTTPPSQTLVGITVFRASDVALENLTVQGMRWGIRLDGGASATLTDVVLQENRTGLLVTNSSSASLAECTARNNVNYGLTAWQGSSLNVTSGTVVASNNLYGFVLSGSSIGMESGSRIEANDNGGGGIALQLSASALLAAGTVVANGNGGPGISAESNSSVGVSGLEAVGNQQGVWADGAEIDLFGATVTNNVEGGVFGVDAATVILSGSSTVGNTVSNNGGSGIDISQNSFLSLSRTTIQGNGQPGIVVDGGVVSVFWYTIVTGHSGADVALSFGARAAFNGNPGSIGTVTCDPSVLVRGNESCASVPAPASSPTQVHAKGTAPGLTGTSRPREVLERKPLQLAP
jgi:parallel beta-helix repeat protein